MQAVIDDLDEVSKLIAATLPGNIHQPGRRTQIAVAYAHIVLQHQRAITTTLNQRLNSAAMAFAA